MGFRIAQTKTLADCGTQDMLWHVVIDMVDQAENHKVFLKVSLSAAAGVMEGGEVRFVFCATRVWQNGLQSQAEVDR